MRILYTNLDWYVVKSHGFLAAGTWTKRYSRWATPTCLNTTLASCTAASLHSLRTLGYGNGRCSFCYISGIEWGESFSLCQKLVLTHWPYCCLITLFNISYRIVSCLSLCSSAFMFFNGTLGPMLGVHSFQFTDHNTGISLLLSTIFWGPR